MNEDKYVELQQLNLVGDYLSFFKLYEEVVIFTMPTCLLAFKTALQSGQWHRLNLLKERIKDNSDDNDVKIELQFRFKLFELISKPKSREDFYNFISSCNELLKTDLNQKHVFLLKSSIIKVRLMLVQTGQVDAEQKAKLIKDGVSLLESQPFEGEYIAFSRSIIQCLSKPPMAEVNQAFEELDTFLAKCIKLEGQHLKMTSSYMLYLELWLKINCAIEVLDKETLPYELEKMRLLLKKMGWLPVEGFLNCIYGNHLLQLEYIEGIDWITKGVPELVKYGHFKDAETYLKKANNWLENRGQVVLKKKFDKINSVLKHNKILLPSEKEILQLNQAHQSFTQSDFSASMRILNEKKTTEKYFLFGASNSLLKANSLSKLKLETTPLKSILLEELNKLDKVHHSIQKAELLKQMAIVCTHTERQRYYEKAIATYDFLKLKEASLHCQMDMLIDIATQNKINGKKIMDEQVNNSIASIGKKLNTPEFLEYRYSLIAKFYTQVAQLMGLENKIYEKSGQLAKAIELYTRASNHSWRAQTQIHLGMSYIEYGRKTELKFYQKAQKILKEAAQALEKTQLSEFTWRAYFQVALSHSEPILNGMVNGEEKTEYTMNAGQYYFMAQNLITLQIQKISLKSGSANWEAILKLKQDTRQLISSGYEFFLFTMQFKICLVWLEGFRATALLVKIANKTNLPDELGSDKIRVKESRLLKKMGQSKTVLEEKRIRRKLQDLYEPMLEHPSLANFARLKLGHPVDFETTIALVKEQERALGTKKLFTLYYYHNQNAIYVLGIGTAYRELLVKRINIKISELDKAIDVFNIKLNSAHKLGKKPHESLWTRFSPLIDPVKEWTKKDDIICIIPYGNLHNLPFHALLLNGEPLIKRNPVFYNSSIGSWLYTANHMTKKPKSATVFGNPSHDLQESEQEIEYVANVLKVKPLSGKDVTAKAFKKAIRESDILHYAGHGFYDNKYGFEFSLQLYGDDTLNAGDLMEIDKVSNFIVLSSCHLGMQRNNVGEELTGLVSSFLAAGSKSVLASLWAVHDTDAKDFFMEFYKYIDQGIPKVVAFQKTCIHLMNRKDGDHLYHWAMFLLQGYWK